MIRRLFLLLILLIVVAGAYGAWLAATPVSPSREETFVVIPSGATTRKMASMLAEAGVIRSQEAFLLVRVLKRSDVLQAGEYRFSGAASALDVFGRIARGDIYYRELRVPEGSNMFDIGEAIEKLGIASQKEFLKVARDPSLIRDLAPDAPSLEGYLFPSVYRVSRQTTAQQVAREMTSTFRRTWSELGGTREGVNRLVTMASLVEKETAVPAERSTVASVYYNRLRLGMKLDCDPTTIYAALLENRYRGTIYRSDLDSTHPYNTYRNPGLPPGAIANPGLASLKAALAPAETSFLYFVAKPGGSGAHAFSETLDQHNAAVRDYRQQ